MLNRLFGAAPTVPSKDGPEISAGEGNTLNVLL